MNRFFLLTFLLAGTLLNAITLTVSTPIELYNALNRSQSDLEITLETGIYDLIPIPVTDSTLGNALNPDSMITVSAGLHIVGKNVALIGKDRNKTIINTHAGYGIFIEHCPRVLIKDLTIADGTRDQDGDATSGAIVVKHSETEVSGCLIENNQGDFSATVTGIIGVCGREGSNLYIHNNIIHDNSWDGVALYRGASARIENNLIYNGRGAGIGITWDAQADVSHNVIHHYWKGIGTFGTSSANVSHNLVRDVRGWGIIASGNSGISCYYNEVRRSGNVGMAVWDDTASMFFYGNVVCLSGQEKQWIAPAVGIWVTAPDSLVKMNQNLFWGNKEADIAYGYKEPGPDGAAFTFDHACEKFNNFSFKPTPTLNDTNYYKPDYAEPVYSSFRQEIPNPEVGIMAGDKQNQSWSWDPDGEPLLETE